MARYFLSPEEFETVTAIELGARLERGVKIAIESVGLVRSDEDIHSAVLSSLLNDRKTLTVAEYNELAAAWDSEPIVSREEKAREENAVAHKAFFVEKPQPSPKHYRCQKCGGTGKFVLYFENGSPKSNTGYDCYGCGGAGWKLRRR